MKITIGPLGVLCILFILLKLAGAIAWSWWWVLSPVLIPLGVAVILLAVSSLVDR